MVGSAVRQRIGTERDATLRVTTDTTGRKRPARLGADMTDDVRACPAQRSRGRQQEERS